MKYSKFFLPTLREAPQDAVIASHQLMLRAGLIRKLSNGLYAYLPLGLRAFRKVEEIIREEMAAIDCLEIKPPVVVPGDVWKESGRWDTMGDAMLRVKNRVGQDLVVSPTAEEAVTALVRAELSSYKQLPVSVYQINTKYRDEIRPRYGVMRGREFVMYDGYSYHADQAGLDATYNDMERAYKRIFARCGLSTIPVRADSGAMGGSGSEEFMVESEVGDNTLLICPDCDYAANVEKAECKETKEQGQGYGVKGMGDSYASTTLNPNPQTLDPLQKISTPGVKSIADLCAFIHCEPTSTTKTLVYQAVNIEADSPLVQMKSEFVAVCIRGDLDVNETKLAAVLKAGEVALAPAEDTERLTGAPFGSIGPVGLTKLPVLTDYSAAAIPVTAVGALEKDFHYINVVFGRDWKPWKVADVRTVKAGDRCPLCGGELYEKKGNELGHIFKLGYKYTKSMKVSFLDEAGKAQTPIMGCYGIGLDRTLASVIEEHHDEAGIIWPASAAPFHVSVVPIKYTGAMKDAADRLEKELTVAGLEVLLDDRAERPGVKFNDADLLGFPFRVVVGDKNLAKTPPVVEVKRRNEKEARLVELDKAASMIAAEIAGE
jgi:prolyl-tRNA synthetase